MISGHLFFHEKYIVSPSEFAKIRQNFQYFRGGSFFFPWKKKVVGGTLPYKFTLSFFYVKKKKKKKKKKKNEKKKTDFGGGGTLGVVSGKEKNLWVDY